MKKQLLTFILFAVVFCNATNSLFAQCGASLPTQLPLGCGLNGLSDYDFDRPFNDILKSARAFSTNLNAPWTTPYTFPTLDADGWPTEDFALVVMTMSSAETANGGTYKVRFNGSATIGGYSGSWSLNNQVYDATTNTTTANLVATPGAALSLNLKFTNTNYSSTVAGIKNLQIMKPGTDFNSPLFDSTFLQHLSRFNCLRFMDWSHTNASIDSVWQYRTLPSLPTQTNPTANGNKHGVCWEYCIRLANVLNKDIWINIPHKADSNYIVQLATLLRDSLNPALHVYIEHSNEVWNGGFAQFHYNLAKANYEVTLPGNTYNYDNINNQYYWANRRHALRTKTISDLFGNVFGSNEVNQRFRVMFGGQFANIGSIDGLEYINNNFGKPSNFFYGATVAPYFNSHSLDTTNSATVQQVLDALQNSIDSDIFPTYRKSIEVWLASCKTHGLKLTSYEGGPDTFGPNNIAVKAQANRSPQMKDICFNFLKRWYEYGFENQFNWFTGGAGNWGTQYGTWSLTESFENSYKLQAMDSILNLTPFYPTVAQAIPGTVAAHLALAGADSATINASVYQTSTWKKYEDFLIRVPNDSAGTFDFSIETANNAELKMLVYIDGNFIDTLHVANSGSDNFVVAHLDTVSLAEGIHTVRLKRISSWFYIRNFIFERTEICTDMANAMDESNLPEMKIYPNPSNGNVNIEIKLQAFDKASLSIINTLGETAFNQNFTQLGGIHKISVNNKLATGIYFIKLQTEAGIVTKKLMINEQ